MNEAQTRCAFLHTKFCRENFCGSRDGSLTHSKTVVIDGTAIQNDNYC